MSRSLLRLIRSLSLVLAFTFSLAALAAPAAGLHGTVFDPSGAAVPNAQVELIENGQLVAAVTTDAKGQYSISSKLTPGLIVRVSAQGFSSKQKIIAPAANANEIAVDVVLPLATFSEQVTVTATGAPTPQSQLGASVTVLDASSYQGTRDLQERLRFIPGLQATQSGQAGGATSLFIRGGGSGANKVLIDGIPVNDIGGNVDYARITSAAVAQAEVLRGPNSALYGSDALAGVVSLTTAKGSTPFPLLTYRAGGGNFGTYRQEGSLGGSYRKLDYFSDYSRFDTRNSIPNSTFHNGTFAGNYGWAITPTSSLRATIHHDQIASGQPDAFELYGMANDAKRTNEDAYFGATLENKTTPKWNQLLRYGGSRLRSDYVDFSPTGTPYYSYGYLAGYLGNQVTLRGANGYSVSGQALFQYAGTYPSHSPSATDKDFVYAQTDYRLNEHLRGLVGFRYENERGFTASHSNSIERDNYSYTFELQGAVRGRLFYTLGSGLEDNGLFGIAGTPRASLAWQVAGGTKLRVSFGKGIKEAGIYDQLESLYALLKKNSYDSLIAQDHIAPIGPENSRTYDGGVDQYFFGGRTRMSLSLFHNEFTNGIEYVPPQGLTLLGLPADIVAIAQSTYYGATVNSKAYRSQGVEAEFESQITREWFARAGYTYVDAKIQRSFTSDALGASYNLSSDFSTVAIGAYSPLVGARPFRIAPHTGYFQAGYRHKKAYAALSGTLVSRRDDSTFLSDGDYGTSMLLPNRNLDSAYQKLDLNGSYQATRNLAFEGSFQNLLSQHYNEAFGYPAQPFNFRLGMKFTLGGESWRVK
jgi:vitamin B12 transporter